MVKYHKNNRLFSFVCLVLVTAFLMSFIVVFSAYEVKTGTMNIQPVTYRLPMRADAGISNRIVAYVENGEKIEIIGEKEDKNGVLWYQIHAWGSNGTVYTGYVRADYVDVDVPADAEYEKYLEAQGFPESYRVSLRRLHYYYPEWQFVAVKKGLDWEKSIDAEYSLGVSLVDPSSPSSWKSTQPGAYDWTTGKWSSFDYGLHAASREIIAYYLDPRNSLDRNAVFQFLGQGFDDAQTVSGIEKIVAGTFLSKTVTDTDEEPLYYPDAIYKAGKEANVNPYVLAAKIKQEIGATESGSVSGTVKGYENLFNFYNILAWAHDGNSAIVNGLIYAGGSGSYGRPWNTRYKAILGGAQWFNRNYGKDGAGTFYNNRFAINENYTLGLQYMTNVGSSLSEGQAFALGYPESARHTVLKFYIPVYENMPENVCQKPTVTGSPNNKLSSLSVDGFSIGPEFNTDRYEYSLIVPSSTETVTVNATAYDGKAKITGAGTVSLNYGANEINVAVAAENGAVRTYTVIISRQEPQGAEPKVEISYRNENGILRGVSPDLTVSAFLSKIKVSDGTVAVVGKTETSTVATGDAVAVYRLDGSEYQKFTVVIKGDASGDGKIMINDIIKLRNHLLGTSVLSGAFAAAADVSGDGKIMINDIILIRNHLLGTKAIVQ